MSCCEVKVGMKRKARDTQDSSHQIVGETLQTVSEGTSAKLPELDSHKRTIQRQRVRLQAAPVQPTSLEQLTLPEEYKLFTQVYVIHALRGGPDLMKDGHLLPSLFVLLPNKTEATYRRMWEQVELLCPQADPTVMLMDFELAAINSFQHTWPATMVKGCFFHLTQNLWRKVQATGMQPAYCQDEELAIRIRQIPALAFAAPHEVPHLFDQVAALLPSPAADDLIEYFERLTRHSVYLGQRMQWKHGIAASMRLSGVIIPTSGSLSLH